MQPDRADRLRALRRHLDARQQARRCEPCGERGGAVVRDVGARAG